MAIGKASDFKVYDELVVGTIIERIAQNIAGFNGPSRNTIRLTTERQRGHYAMTSFFKNLTLVSRRDITSVADVTDLAMTQDEWVRVKLNRKIGPVAQTRDAFKKLGLPVDVDTISTYLGTEVADQMTQDMLNEGLLACRAALVTEANTMYTVPASGTLATDPLVKALAKFGDQAQRVQMWVMHSKPFYDLVSAQIAANITGVSNFAIANASPITLNRPVLVTDSPALKVAGASPALDDYYTLGLAENGVIVEDSEQTDFLSQDVTGKENLIIRYQGEYAYNVGLKGFKWDVTNGGSNPNDAAVGTGTNWDKVATSIKDLAGVIVKSR